MDKERRWVESSIYNVERVVWTNYNILWTHKLFYNVSNDNKWDLIGSDQYWRSSKFYWWCYSRNKGRRGTWWNSRRDSKEVGREWLIHKTRRIQVEG